MKLREILEKVGINIADVERSLDFKSKNKLDWEVSVHQAGEQADEIVHVELVYENRTIYLEYE